MKILMVLTSHEQLGNTGHKTGFWVEEFAAPYYVFADNGIRVTLSSPKGGQPPIDPKSEQPENQTDSTRRFYSDKKLQQELSQTKKLSEVSAGDYDAVFYPGGHGPLWDLAGDPDSIKLIEAFATAGKPVVAVCHAPAVLLNAKGPNSEPLVKGKKVTGFSNAEEEAVQLTNVVPFLLEDELKKKGGIYSKKENWAPYVIHDGLLITGQNPASSERAAEELISIFKDRESLTSNIK